jgi:hypothetical protein
MRILLSDPAQLEELRAALGKAECVSVPVSKDTLLVLHPLEVSEKEATTEIAFFVKAWCSRRPGLSVELAA